MSATMTSSAAVAVESNGVAVADQATPVEVQQPVVSAAAPVDQAAVEAAAEAAAAVVAERRKEAALVLDKAVRNYVKGEAGYKAGLLEAGRLAGEYVALRLAIGDTRDVAVNTVTGAMSAECSSDPRVNRLILAYHAHRLLGLEQGIVGAGKKAGVADWVSHESYRDQWSRLVDRANPGLATESYVLLPGHEDGCKSAFLKAATERLGKAAVGKLIDDVAVAYKAQTAARDKEAAEAARKAKADATAAMEAEAAKLREAEKAHNATTAAALANTNEQTTAAAAESLDALKAQQEATIAAQAVAEQAEKDRKAAERRVKAEEDRKAKDAKDAAAKAEKDKSAREQEATLSSAAGAAAASSGTPAPAVKEGHVVGNIARMQEMASVKDGAEMAAGFVTGSERPDDVLEALLGLLAADKRLGGKAHRACKAALVILTRTAAEERAMQTPATK